MEGAAAEILALSDLLAGCDDAGYNQDEDAQQRSITPATLARGAEKRLPEFDRPIGQIKRADPKAIWEPEEVPSDDDDDSFDTRTRPTFEILYKQSVMTEDVFLGLSDKDPSSAHCEAMVVRVDCPRHKREDIELDVKRQKLLLQSPTLKLSLYLPYPVRHQDGHARWDSATQTLSITLPIIRDECALARLQELHLADPTAERVSLRGFRLDVCDKELAFIQHHFPNLRHLDLSDNALRSLPDALGDMLPKLVALDVSGNSFKSIPALSESLATCPSLRSLSVSLRTKTEERVLLVSLPQLRILNGTPLHLGGNVLPSPPLNDATETNDEEDEEDEEQSEVGSSEEDPVKVMKKPERGDDSRRNPETDLLDGTHGLTQLSELDLSFAPRGDDDEEAEVMWLNTPPSVPSSPEPDAPPVPRSSSPLQHKRELLVRHAQLKLVTQPSQRKAPVSSKGAQPRKRPPATKASSKSSSVRPTELPATITDERTDWRKLLKPQDDAPTSPPPPAPPLPTKPSEPRQSTKAFIAELRAIVRMFQQHELSTTRRAPMRNSGKLSVSGGVEQLQRQIDTLAAQLEALEPSKAGGDDSSPSELRGLSLRWELLTASSRYGADRVGDMDKQLGIGVDRLLRAQRCVVDALLRHAGALMETNTALTSRGAGTEEQKQQMTILLDVAETLERDLEALQSRFHDEKTQREKTEEENAVLRKELDGLKQQLGKASGLQRTRRRHESPSKSPAVAVAVPAEKEKNHKTPGPPGPTRTQAKTDAKRPSSPLSSAALAVPEAIRSLTLKQLVDLIHCILASKRKYDARTREVGAPPETMEQHMYTYLTQRFGLQRLTVEYASAIWKGCQLHTREDNDVAVFHALLRNRVDEGFLAIKHRLREALRELLRAYFHARFPMKPEAAIQRLVESRLKGDILQEEWTEMLLYLYDPSDVPQYGLSRWPT
ncbi:hypothetical protein ATCC90586_010130 [Pythium insidiosum]|nr:hypothetical protein ATCC90586_010130 [Pythium insidiosum]